MSETIEKKSALADVLQHIDRVQTELQRAAPAVAKAYEALRDQASRPGADQDDGIRRRVAYALQDTERAVGVALPDAHPLRREMTQLATQYPGLTDPKTAELLRATPQLQDQHAVNAIRSLAQDVGLQMEHPDHPDVAFKIDRLHDRIFRQPETEASAKSGPMHASPGGGGAPDGPAETSTANRQSASHQSATPGSDPARNPSHNGASAPQDADARAAQDSARAAPQTDQVVRMSGISRLAQAIATRIEARPAQTTPGWLDRAADFSARQHDARDENSLNATEKLGRDALSALQAVRERPASSVMSAISERAKGDPNGLPGVIADMKPGGKNEDLHTQFVTERQNNRAFAAQLEDVATKLEAYGKGREAAVGAAARLGKVDAVTDRFARLDAELGKGAAELPGKKEGANMLEEMSEKAREIVKKAIEAIAKLVNPSPRASASPTP